MAAIWEKISRMDIQSDHTTLADAKKARDAWMATEAFTEFCLESFREAVRRAVADQAARGLTPPA